MVSQIKVDKILESTSSAGVHIPGHIIQVATGTDNDDNSISDNSYVDTGLSVSITPKYASSKILVIAQHYTLVYAPGTVPFALFQLLRDSTTLTTDVPNGMKADDHPSDNNAYKAHSFNITYLDSPNYYISFDIQQHKLSIQVQVRGYVFTAYKFSGTDTVEHIIAMEIGQ